MSGENFIQYIFILSDAKLPQIVIRPLLTACSMFGVIGGSPLGLPSALHATVTNCLKADIDAILHNRHLAQPPPVKQTPGRPVRAATPSPAPV